MYLGFALNSSEIQISPANILFVSKTSWRRLQDISSRCLEDVFSWQFSVFQDIFKMSCEISSLRRLEDVTEDQNLLLWRRVEDVLKTNVCWDKSSEDVFKMSWSRPIYSSWSYVFKTSSRRFQDFFKTSSRRLAITSLRRLQNFFKMFCKNVFKTFSKRLQDLFKISSGRFSRCIV